jgi:hypothetical protein
LPPPLACSPVRRFDLSFCFFAARAGGVRSFFFTVLTPGRRAVALADRVRFEAFGPLRTFCFFTISFADASL